MLLYLLILLWYNQQYEDWLVVSTPLTNISQLELLFPINGKIKNVPNHQPGDIYICMDISWYIVGVPNNMRWVCLEMHWISKNMILNTCRTSGFECSGILQVSVASVDSVYPDMPEKTPWELVNLSALVVVLAHQPSTYHSSVWLLIGFITGLVG